ncbi:MAG: hypothetical protein WC661_15775 [Opitutaceae bacterium]|jgi:hypothetical protein
MTRTRLFSSLVALLVLLGAGLWLLTHSRDKETSSSGLPAASRSSSTPPPATTGTTAANTPANPAPTGTKSAPATVKSPSLSIGDLLADSSLDNKAVMAGLSKITLDATRNLAERTEAMSHLLNLSVEDPSPVLLPLITDTRLPDVLCNQILDDSLNDPLPWQADAHFAALTHRNGKEVQAKARDHLAFLVGTDYGDNLTEWSKAITASKTKWDQPQK